MTVEDLKTTMQQLAEDWGLKPTTCPQPFELKAGTLCYSLHETDTQFQKRIDAVDRKTLRPITGWRDDYGVMSGAFQYKREMHEIGIGLVRENNFTSQPRFDKLRASKVHAYVAIDVTGDKPRDR